MEGIAHVDFKICVGFMVSDDFDYELSVINVLREMSLHNYSLQ